MTDITLRNAVLVKEVHQVAGREGLDAAEVVEEAVRRHIAAYRQKRIAKETRAWHQLPSAYRKQYEGQFVGVYNGQVVDTDPDRLTLYLRLRDQYERQPILITEGGDYPIPEYRIRSAWRG